MNKISKKIILRKKRIKRNKAKISNGDFLSRLSVFRSDKHIGVQLIDDKSGKTLLSFSDQKIIDNKKMKKIDVAYQVGKKIGKLALDKKITKCVFDRRWYKYHGRIKKLAEGARESGLKF